MLRVRHVVTCFLESENKILLLRRSEKVSTYQGKWAGVSGSIEEDADKQVYIEIEEETALGHDDVEMVRKGNPLIVKDRELRIQWIVHPYLFHIREPKKIKIDWEHKEAKWIEPAEIDKYATVPQLKKALFQLLE